MLMMGFFVILWVLKPSATPNHPERTKSIAKWSRKSASFGVSLDPNNPFDAEHDSKN